MSHICLDCGWDLARVRAFREPRYGLPLVLCPRCGAAATRRRHPAIMRCRQFWRAIHTAVALVSQLGAFSGLCTLLSVCCVVIADDLRRGRMPGPTDALSRGLVIGLVLLLCVGVGAWLTVGLAHWRRWIAWSSFSIWMVLVVGADVWLAPCAIWLLDQIATVDVRLTFRPEFWFTRMGVLAVLMVAAVAGIPVGSALQRLWKAIRKQRWRARRRRLRLRRLT